jgi:hypothetical protein
MANRTASLSDVNFYSSSYPMMTQGDIIVDTPFATANGKTQLIINLSNSPYSNARTGSNIWISASLGSIYYFNLDGGATYWPQSIDEENPVTLRPLGGKVYMQHTNDSNDGFTLDVYNMQHFCIDGEVSGSWGMKYPRGTYLNMGFVFDGSGSQEAFSGIRYSPHDTQGTLVVRGVEMSQGFSALRVSVINNTSSLQKFVLERCYIHDTEDGEGIYMGMTSGDPRPTFYKPTIVNCIFARTAKESIQFQQMRSGSGEFKNFVVYGAASKWKDSSIGTGQDNAIQRMHEEGKHTIKNFIVDGGVQSFIWFGYPSGSIIPENRIRTLNGLMNQNRARMVYVHSWAKEGLKWEHRNLWLGNANNTATEINASYNYTHYISTNNGTDEHLWDGIYADDNKANVFESTPSTYTFPSGGYSKGNVIPAPQYVNSGFPGKTTEQIEKWVNTQYQPANTSASYKIGDVAMYYTGGLSAYFYECIVPHSSSINSIPPNAPTTWSAITWDSAGIPSYWTASHNTSSQQYLYPPDDYRLISTDIWNKRGMGLYDNEETDDYTNFRWYIADNISGSNAIRLVTENSTRYEKRDKKDIGKYIRLQANFKDQAGNRKEVWVNNWTLIT